MPSVVTRMFAGLRSLWITRFWCAYCTAEQIERKRRSRSRMPRPWLSQYSPSGLPWMYSMTKYDRPSSVVPPSNSFAMFGWSSAARICLSLRNRATISAESIPLRMTLIATCLRNSWSARAAR